MDYATEKLTESLQQLTAKEIQADAERKADTDVKQGSYSVISLPPPPIGVNQFLEARREFQEVTRDVSMGAY